MKAVMMLTDTASYLATTEDAIYKLVETQAIPFHRLGRRLVFLQAEIDAWLARLPGTDVETAARAKTWPGSVSDPPSVSPVEADPSKPIVLVRRPAKPKPPKYQAQ